MFDRIKELITTAHTPPRPCRTGKIIFPIAAAFSFASMFVYLLGEKVNWVAVIPSFGTGLGYLFSWIVLLARNKTEDIRITVNHFFFVALCLCIASELALTIMSGYMLCCGMVTATLNNILSVLSNAVAVGMYAYLIRFAAHDEALLKIYGKRVRVILCIFNLVLLSICVMQNLISLASNEVSLEVFIVSPFITVFTIFLVYYPWVLFVASMQYPDAHVKSFSERRTEKKAKKAEKKAARKELYQTLRKAVDSNYEPVRSPLLRRKHK